MCVGVYVGVCVCIGVCRCMKVYVGVCVGVCVGTCMRMYVSVCVCVCMRALYTHTPTPTHASIDE